MVAEGRQILGFGSTHFCSLIPLDKVNFQSSNCCGNMPNAKWFEFDENLKVLNVVGYLSKAYFKLPVFKSQSLILSNKQLVRIILESGEKPTRSTLFLCFKPRFS